MKFTEHMKALIERRMAAEERDPIWTYASKIGVRHLAHELDVQVPELWSMFGPAWDVEPPPWAGCVIKPLSASNSRGVLPLSRHEGFGGWRSLMGDGIRRWNEWGEWSLLELERHQEAGVEPYNPSWLCEELVTREAGNGTRLLPYDWKCYAIGGRVAWINQIDKTSSRNATTYRTRHWWRVDGLRPARKPIIEQTRHRGHLPRPRQEERLLEVADQVARGIRERTGTPFVRVDLYEHDDGRILLGEITPHPSGGREIYSEEADRVLGQLWTDLEAA